MAQKSKIKMSSNRSFGLVFFLVFFIISIWSFRGDLQQIKIVPISISLIFLFLGIINSRILTPLNMLWYKFGLFLGSIIAPIVMAIIFFAVITPIGIIMNSIKKDYLGKKIDKNKKTYWIKYKKPNNTMKKQF
tara:strand:- start:5141 stop:5539 length:399 start_codon:yes stop_codon:yes gene_type:complete